MNNDILDGLVRIRHSFLAANLNPPASINLETHEDGMKLLSSVAQSNLIFTPRDERLGKPVEMADGSIFMECELMGMKVRWPANKFASPDGSWSFV